MGFFYDFFSLETASATMSSCSCLTKDMTIQINRAGSVIHQEEKILLYFYSDIIWSLQYLNFLS